MGLKISPPSSQQGIVLPLVAISLTGLLAVAGLALDAGHLYIDKSRLQSVVDAAALSAAKTLDETGSTGQALTAAQNTFGLNTSTHENAELSGISKNNVSVSFSRTPTPFNTASTPPLYVRVSVNSFAIPTGFIGILGIGTQTVAASAVAGPSPLLTEVCDTLPLLACTGRGGSYYGYTLGQEAILKTGSGSKNWDVGSGNFRTLQLNCGQGADCLRDNFAGAYNACLSLGSSVTTKPGNSVGSIAQGINSRFGCASSGCGSLDTRLYPPDKVTDAGNRGYPDTYLNYQTDYTHSDWDFPGGRDQRRFVQVAMADCSGTVNGQGTLTIQGFGCFFLTRPAEQSGNQRVYGEFIGQCNTHGSVGNLPIFGQGPHKIILYKDYSAGREDA